MTLEQKPITGSEINEPLTAPLRALSDFYQAFNNRDLEAMSRNWARTDDIAMDNPLGGIRRGWTGIRMVYERIFAGPAKVYVEFYDYTVHEADDMFYAVGRERGEFALGDDVIKLAIRTSIIFIKIHGSWKQVHHHGSIEDPALLRRYQTAVMTGTIGRDEQAGEQDKGRTVDEDGH
jgi:ketosteroid isomerase-like protein